MVCVCGLMYVVGVRIYQYEVYVCGGCGVCVVSRMWWVVGVRIYVSV